LIRKREIGKCLAMNTALLLWISSPTAPANAPWESSAIWNSVTRLLKASAGNFIEFHSATS